MLNIDLAIAFDTTASEEAFNDMKRFASGMLDHFKIGWRDTHISLSTFAKETVLSENFFDEFNKEKIKGNINKLKASGGGGADLAKFLAFARRNIFSVSGRARQSQPRHLIILTTSTFPSSQVSQDLCYTLFFYKKVVYKKVYIKRPKIKKVFIYNILMLRNFFV